MKKNDFRFVAALLTLALAGGVSTATGCGGASISSLCEDICACSRCTSNDVQACEDKGNKASDDAAAAGCGSEFDDAVTCTSAHVSCQSGNQVGSGGCDAELAALSKCSRTLSVFGKSPCEIATDQILAKLAACPKPPQPTSSSSGGQAECTTAEGTLFLCQAAALVQAPCDCIGGGDTTLCTSEQAKTFTDAISTCK